MMFSILRNCIFNIKDISIDAVAHLHVNCTRVVVTDIARTNRKFSSEQCIFVVRPNIFFYFHCQLKHVIRKAEITCLLIICVTPNFSIIFKLNNEFFFSDCHSPIRP
jgi:hypothetical protein